MRKFLFEELPHILRIHIVIVALLATVVFGFIFTGHRPFELMIFVAIDWFVINLVNRVTDLAEDLANGVPGAEKVAKKKRAVEVLSALMFFGSLPLSHYFIAPALTPFRFIVQIIGLAYNFKIIPWPGGLTRFKQMYFFKNTMSAVIFVFTCVIYPLAQVNFAPIVPWATVIAIVIFFVPFELSYEILYDFRDLEGDRAENVPTYPVVHGPQTAKKILVGLLVFSALTVAVAFGLRVFGMRELLMIAAPISQWFFYRNRLERGLTQQDCVVLTNLGSAQLALFLVGTRIWALAGLPENIFL